MNNWKKNMIAAAVLLVVCAYTLTVTTTGDGAVTKATFRFMHAA